MVIGPGNNCVFELGAWQNMKIKKYVFLSENWFCRQYSSVFCLWYISLNSDSSACALQQRVGALLAAAREMPSQQQRPCRAINKKIKLFKRIHFLSNLGGCQSNQNLYVSCWHVTNRWSYRYKWCYSLFKWRIWELLFRSNGWWRIWYFK